VQKQQKCAKSTDYVNKAYVIEIQILDPPQLTTEFHHEDWGYKVFV
jgi:hypothetical protein